MLFSSNKNLYRSVGCDLFKKRTGHSAHNRSTLNYSTPGWALIGYPFDVRLAMLTLGFFVIALLIQPINSSAQNFTRTIHKSAEFTDKSDPENKFRLMNINGSVTIEAYDGDTIELTVNEKITGSASEIEKGKKELSYNLEKKGNLILAYVDAPFINLWFQDYDEIHYNINRQHEDYQFIHEVHVKVPRGIRLEGSTINKGKLSITGPFREVEASNVNGKLDLHHMVSKTFANTVNGNITVSYDQAPNQDSEYHTVNGTINVFMPKDLSADVYFKSMQGDLYTDFENVKRLKPEVKKEIHSNGSAATYHIEKFSPLRIGDGKIKLRFQVLNGDVYLRKQP